MIFDRLSSEELRGLNRIETLLVVGDMVGQGADLIVREMNIREGLHKFTDLEGVFLSEDDPEGFDFEIHLIERVTDEDEKPFHTSDLRVQYDKHWTWFRDLLVNIKIRGCEQ